jgi:hypothetical protein
VLSRFSSSLLLLLNVLIVVVDNDAIGGGGIHTIADGPGTIICRLHLMQFLVVLFNIFSVELFGGCSFKIPEIC